MDKLSQLKADKAPLLVTATPEEQILEHQSNMETLWRKVSDILFMVKDVLSKLNQLKTDLTEKLFTRRLGTNTLSFNTSLSTKPTEVGTLYYDEQDKTLSVVLENSTLQIGQEQYIVCVNKTGSTINNGAVVFINGAQGNRPTIALADADNYDDSTCVIGVATHNILNNAVGMITTNGLVRDLNTNSYTEGDKVYLSTTAGQFTATKPTNGKNRVRIGVIVKSHVVDGWLCVRIENDKYMFGDPQNGNCTKFEDDGTMVALGNATTYRDEITDALKLQQVGTGVSLNNAENTVEFNNASNLSDYMFTNVQLNHDRDLTSSIYPHLHTFQTVSGNPNYLLQYRWQINGRQKVSGWTNLKCNTPTFTYVSGTLNQIYYSSGITPPSGTNLSDIVQFRVLRDNANTSAVFSGADPVGVTVGISSFDVHFKTDTLGSRTEYSK